MNYFDPRRSFGLDNRMTVVLFAGMGGGCDGLEAAGYPVHLAINHDKLAIAVHEKRHPHTTHMRCDVFEVDPRKATQGRGVRALHASPDCTHFSVAKGSKPVSKRRRSLAWVVVRWMGQVRPEVVTLENVQEIQTWGPLVAKRDKATGRVLKLDGTVAAKGEVVPIGNQQLVPDKRHQGRIWRAWLKHVARLGYNFEGRVLVCADYGVPTIRKRFFGVAKADGSPIVWPERTHAPRKLARKLGLKRWVGAHTIIDWSLPMKSIFGRKKPLADATLCRIARGVMRYVVEAQDPFIVPTCQTGSTTAGRPVSEPLATMTTAKGGELMLVSPIVAGVGGRAAQTEPRDLREPLNTTSTKEDRVLAGAVLTKFRTGDKGADIAEPLPTFTANNFEKRPGGAPPLGLVAATMVGLAHGDSGGRREYDLRDDPTLTRHAGGNNEAIIAATLVQTGYGERAGQAPRALDLGEPLGTQVAGGGKAALVAAFMAKHYGGVVGAEMTEPVPTLTMGGNRGVPQVAVAAATLGRLRGADVDGQDLRQPLPTQTCGGGHEMLILPFLQAYYQSGSEGQRVDEPLRALTGVARHGLVCVEVNGQTMVMTDILMRMLDWSEGARAHGFDPDSLRHDIEVTDKKGRTIRRPPTKTECGHLIGNSVPPEMVRLLAAHNVTPALAAGGVR